MAMVKMEMDEAYWMGCHAFEVGFLAGQLAYDAETMAECREITLAGLVEFGPAHAQLGGVTIRSAECDAFETDDVCRFDAGCPKCGNRWTEDLHWDEDGEDLTCSHCDTTYTPGSKEAE